MFLERRALHFLLPVAKNHHHATTKDGTTSREAERGESEQKHEKRKAGCRGCGAALVWFIRAFLRQEEEEEEVYRCIVYLAFGYVAVSAVQCAVRTACPSPVESNMPSLRLIVPPTRPWEF